MDQNTAAIKALNEYVRITEPKYALMIEAPWGAGKTHLVKHEFRDALQGGSARYASLNGIKDRNAFRRALLVEASDAKLSAAVAKLAETIGSLAQLGNVGSIIHDTLEDRMISNLPNLLIFDDIERCELSPAELLGLINEFVEHNSKNVVLCAYIERDDGSDSGKLKRELFLTLKEKVVGRTVKIIADGGKALPEFISSMPDGPGKQWFNGNIDLVIEVFDAAKHSNLRVMRQCLHDCGRVIDVLDEDLRTSTDAMRRLAYTYLALAMAVATGKLSSIQLADRDNIRSVTKHRDGEDPHPLSDCSDEHPQAEIFAGNAASILPTELGLSLIGVGYEEPERINEVLRATKQFSGERETPLWRRFIGWRWLPTAELHDVYELVTSHIFDDEVIEPGPYLHMANDLISIAKSGDGGAAEMAKKIEERIKSLSEKNRIPAASYGVEYGWSSERGFSFGGFSYHLDELRKPLVEAMRSAQFEAYTATMPEEAKRILTLLASDLDAFSREVCGRNDHPGYHHTEILHLIDPKKFADVVFGYINSGMSKAIGEELEMLADRHRDLDSKKEEQAWVNEVKNALYSLVVESSVVQKAQIEAFFGYHWKFLPESNTDE